MRKFLLIFALIILTASITLAERELVIFHWWTAGGEREAANAMFDVFKCAHPDVKVTENPVAGGGGVSLRVVLQSRLAAGIPPDTWQTLGGAELKSYVDGGYLVPIDDLWNELNYGNLIPKPLANAVTIEGHHYTIPLNMHVQNILYYNKKLFKELGLKPPKTYEELIQVAKAIKKARPKMYPLALGTKEKWEAAFVFDSILLEVGGPEYYVKLYKGEINVKKDPNFKKALEMFKELIPYIYPYHSTLTWDESCGLLVSGDSAMVIMGTWAIGYFETRGWKPGVDFDAVTFPQVPERILLFHPDTYGLAKGAPHPDVVKDWLKTVASKPFQVRTDVVQGGLFARMDISPCYFPDPIRKELQKYIITHPGRLILDQHGSIAPFSFTQAYWDVIAGFLSRPNLEKTISDVENMLELYDVKTGASWYKWP